MVKGEQSDDMQERGKEAGNNSKSKGKGKGKGKGKDKDKGKAGNHVRDGDGSPLHELSDPWDDLRNAWAVEFSQSRKSGEGTHQNQNRNQNHSQQPKQQHQNHQNHHPYGQQSGSASTQNRRGCSSGQVHAGQKRRATESVTNGVTGTDDGDRGHAPNRQKSERRLPPPPPSRPNSEPNAFSPGAAARSHPDFWYPDGSVIIQVQGTKFRLHQSTLRKFSTYFAAASRGRGAMGAMDARTSRSKLTSGAQTVITSLSTALLKRRRTISRRC